ncbi:MAG: adenylate/guanylate cyclase domain-containing protein [Caldimonas sp.]
MSEALPRRCAKSLGRPRVQRPRSCIDVSCKGDGTQDSGYAREVKTVLFTNIVSSTEHLAALGDQAWRDLLAKHHAMVRQELDRFDGREIDIAGDGFLATFEAPALAVGCACEINRNIRSLGIAIRAGIHICECERLQGRIGGMAVHVGARIAATAEPGELLVSSTVKDLVIGSGIAFEDRGARVLRGVPGEWRLFAVQFDSVPIPSPAISRRTAKDLSSGAEVE